MSLNYERLAKALNQFVNDKIMGKDPHETEILQRAKDAKKLVEQKDQEHEVAEGMKTSDQDDKDARNMGFLENRESSLNKDERAMLKMLKDKGVIGNKNYFGLTDKEKQDQDKAKFMGTAK